MHDAGHLLIETKPRGFPMMSNNRIVGQLKHSELLNALIKLDSISLDAIGHLSARTDWQPTFLENGYTGIRLLEINKGSNR